MSLTIVISRFSNLLFFAQKSSQHHLVEVGVRKYLADKNINILFYSKNEDRAWEKIGKVIGNQSTTRIKKSLVSLKLVFTSYWNKATRHLFLWKKYFQTNQSLFQQIIFDVKKLNGTGRFILSKIPIYLISDPFSNDNEINAWFSWTPKESFIVVEIPFGLKVSNNFFPLGVLAHEFFHLMLKKNAALVAQLKGLAEKNVNLFTKLSSECLSNKMFLEELLISSFIPEGYLSEKYLGIKINAYTLKPKDLLDWRKLIAFKQRNKAKKYIENTRKIDKRYLKYIIDVIQQNTKYKSPFRILI